MNAFERTAADIDFGRAVVRKAGRNPRWPYVPVIEHRDGVRMRSEQLLGKAFATRDEALAYANRTLDTRRRSLARKLAQHQHRALRAQHGLPRELSDISTIEVEGRETR